MQMKQTQNTHFDNNNTVTANFTHSSSLISRHLKITWLIKGLCGQLTKENTLNFKKPSNDDWLSNQMTSDSTLRKSRGRARNSVLWLEYKCCMMIQQKSGNFYVQSRTY